MIWFDQIYFDISSILRRHFDIYFQYPIWDQLAELGLTQEFFIQFLSYFLAYLSEEAPETLTKLLFNFFYLFCVTESYHTIIDRTKVNWCYNYIQLHTKTMHKKSPVKNVAKEPYAFFLQGARQIPPISLMTLVTMLQTKRSDFGN